MKKYTTTEYRVQFDVYRGSWADRFHLSFYNNERIISETQTDDPDDSYNRRDTLAWDDSGKSWLTRWETRDADGELITESADPLQDEIRPFYREDDDEDQRDA